jgi:hypothetical protein
MSIHGTFCLQNTNSSRPKFATTRARVWFMGRPRVTCLFLLLAPRSTSGHAVITAGSPSFRGGFSEEDHEPVDAADDEPLIHRSSGRIELVIISTPILAHAAHPPSCHLSTDTRMAMCRSQVRCSVVRAQS